MNDVLVISPSGKLYGSERVLLDFIKNTDLTFDLAVPAESDLYNLLSGEERRRETIAFNPTKLPLFYCKVFFLILTNRYGKIYLNEGAHTRYVLLLAKFFKKANFTIHVRIIEDAAIERWQSVRHKLPPNVSVITISDYLSKQIPFQTDIITDPFEFGHQNPAKISNEAVLHVGVIGRISISKGVELIPLLVEEIKKRKLEEKIIIHLYGEISIEINESFKSVLNNNDNVIIHGFEKDNTVIYKALDAVMHLSEVEPLGRIFFEATDFGLPFIGINSGGIGETARKYGYKDLMVEQREKKEMAVHLVEKLLMVLTEPILYYKAAEKLKANMKKNMSIENYCRKVEFVINRVKAK